MEMESTREAILWQCFDEISFCGNEVKFITSDNEETYTRMSLLNFFSPLFSKMLGKIPLSNLTQDMIVVLLPSVKKTTLTKLLDVLNYGVTAAYTEIPDDDVEDLKDAAQILGIRGFSQLSGSLARISATEVFPRETLPIPLDYSIGVREEERRVVVEEEEDSSVEKEEENFAADLQQSNVDKEEDEKEEGEKLDCTSVEKTSQAFSQPSLEASYSSECGSSTPLASISSIPLPPTPEYSPQAPPKAKDAESEETKFQWESERGPQSRSIPTEMLEKRVEAAAPPVKKDHRVEKEKPRDRKSSNSSERRRAGVKRRRSHERVSENKNRNCRDRGSSSWRSSEGDITRGKRRVLLPKPEQFLRASDGPPVSSLPELQYIYDHKYHKLCGKQHRRIDLCDMAPVHETCGRRHSYAMECSGAWMSLTRFESLAAKWPTSKMIAERLEGQREDRKRRRLTPPPVEQNSICCFKWNCGAQSCHDINCKKRHRCSAEIRPGVVCLGKHRALQHRDLGSRK